MSQFRDQLVDYLAGQGFSASANVLADGLLGRSLTYRVDDSPAERLPSARAIFAFAFGNRVDAHANVEPGPTNQSLAEVASKLSIGHQVPELHAQWEIGGFFSRTRATPLPMHGRGMSYGQRFDRLSGLPKYQSTFSFLEQVKLNLKPETPRIPVIVVAHWYHYSRCLRMTAEAGYDPISIQSLMPTGFDSQSAQIWTTNETLFFLHTLASTAGFWKEELAKAEIAAQSSHAPALNSPLP